MIVSGKDERVEPLWNLQIFNSHLHKFTRILQHQVHSIQSTQFTQGLSYHTAALCIL